MGDLGFISFDEPSDLDRAISRLSRLRSSETILLKEVLFFLPMSGHTEHLCV